MLLEEGLGLLWILAVEWFPQLINSLYSNPKKTRAKKIIVCFVIVVFYFSIELYERQFLKIQQLLKQYKQIQRAQSAISFCLVLNECNT